MSETYSENDQIQGEYFGSVDLDKGLDKDLDNISDNSQIWLDGLDFMYASNGEWQIPFGSGARSVQGETPQEMPFFYAPPYEEQGLFEEEEEVEEEEEELLPYKSKKERREKAAGAQDTKSKSLFVHSFPSQFPDVTKARKSAFGSIFLKTSSDVAEDLALLKSILDSSYIRLNSLLESFQKIISDRNVDPERRRLTASFKESLEKTLEAHGISKTYSDGSVHWDIYPITQSYLFSVYLKDRLHQTRNLARIEERILEGPVRELKLPYSWPTKSIWSGYWDSLGMTSTGIYSMPHGVSYFGKMQDGNFHDTNATLTYPNKFKAVNCVFDKGKLLSCQFQFPDLLVYEDDWKYCKFPDRRFWSEVQNGLKSAKIAQKTQVQPTRNIPPGCYDTGDGFYNPKTLMLESPTGKLLRVPVCEEDLWIKKYCRKGFFEYAGFRPDLFENWFDYDQEVINSILEKQAQFRARKITYDELQQFYADLGLLPSFLPFKKRKTASEIALEELMKGIPEPEFLRPKPMKKFEGHKISKTAGSLTSKGSKESKRSIRSGLSEDKKELSQTGLKSSKISFKTSDSKPSSSEVSDGDKNYRRKIPDKYLVYQPILDLPFKPQRRVVPQKRCIPKKSSSIISDIELPPEDAVDYVSLIEKRNLKKFMKSLVMDVVTKILVKERERHRKRWTWGKKIPQKISKDIDSKTFKVLKELFDSIPDTEEYCDSDPKKTCDLKEFAKDKHGMLKYWGKRIYLLDFKEKPEEEERPKISKMDLAMDANMEFLFAPFLKKDKAPEKFFSLT